MTSIVFTLEIVVIFISAALLYVFFFFYTIRLNYSELKINLVYLASLVIILSFTCLVYKSSSTN